MRRTTAAVVCMSAAKNDRGRHVSLVPVLGNDGTPAASAILRDRSDCAPALVHKRFCCIEHVLVEHVGRRLQDVSLKGERVEHAKNDAFEVSKLVFAMVSQDARQNQRHCNVSHHRVQNCLRQSGKKRLKPGVLLLRLRWLLLLRWSGAALPSFPRSAKRKHHGVEQPEPERLSLGLIEPVGVSSAQENALLDRFLCQPLLIRNSC